MRPLACTLAALLALVIATPSGAQDSQPTSAPATATADFVVPDTAPNPEGGVNYVDAVTYSSVNVEGLAPGTSSPEAAAVHYFAARVRGDTRYEEVLPPADQRSRRLIRGLEEHNEWTFTQFRLENRSERAPGSVWITVFFEIEFDGRTDSGSDQIGVDLIDGVWRVTSVPT